MQNFTKGTWIANAKRFAIESEALERKKNASVKDDELRQELLEMVRTRADAKMNTMKKLGAFKSNLSDIQTKIRNGGWPNSSTLKQQLENFEGRLSSFKLLMRAEYDSLEDTATAIEGEVSRISSEIEAWDLSAQELGSVQNKDFLSAAAQKRNSERQKIDLHRRAFIGMIDRRISALGRDGGWDSCDHDSFVRVWNQIFESSEIFEQQLAQDKLFLGGRREGTGPHTDSAEGDVGSDEPDMDVAGETQLTITHSRQVLMMKKLTIAIPWKASEDFAQHVSWHLQFLRMQLVKKKAVADWKQEQISARKQSNEHALVTEIFQSPRSIDTELSGAGGREAGEADTESLSSKDHMDRSAAKARIAKWRASQAEQLEQEKVEKRRWEEVEANRAEEQRRRKQLINKQQVEHWKKGEELNKELSEQAQARLQRPKTVDPGVLRRRQTRDLELAKTRSEKIDQSNQKKTMRERSVREAAVVVSSTEAERDPSRLLARTKASESNSLTYEGLDQAEQRRRSAGAHGAPIAMTGRDLQFSGRATPQWVKGPRPSC